jgi:hypothetical protein
MLLLSRLANGFLGRLGVQSSALAASHLCYYVDEASVVKNALLGPALESLLSSLLLGDLWSLVADFPSTRQRPMDLPHYPYYLYPTIPSDLGSGVPITSIQSTFVGQSDTHL